MATDRPTPMDSRSPVSAPPMVLSHPYEYVGKFQNMAYGHNMVYGQPTLIPQKLGHYGLRTVQVQLQGYLLAYYQLGGGSGPSQFPPGSPVTPILVGGVRKK